MATLKHRLAPVFKLNTGRVLTKTVGNALYVGFQCTPGGKIEGIHRIWFIETENDVSVVQLNDEESHAILHA